MNDQGERHNIISTDEGLRFGEGEGNVLDEETSIVWCEDGSDNDDKRLELRLIRKVWTERFINPTAFISTMREIWRVHFGVDISNIGKNLLLFQFYHWKDKQKILEGQTWDFDRNAILLCNLDQAIKPSELCFYDLPIWARFYDIPFKGRMNDGNAKLLGEKVGKFVAMEPEEYSGLEKSMRIGVLVDVRNPLKA